MTDPAQLTATQAIRAIRAGSLTPADLMEACLARIAEREPSVRAFAWFDPDAARAAATAARPGPLHGLPVGVKDVLDTFDMPSQYGSPIWDGWRPRSDCAAVAWTRAAGGAVIGKTVTTEFATRSPGPTTNPANPGHTPGGSSSGSAAGVGASMFPLAFGTQTAGSVIRPAAYCGVVGYKPSFGMISRIGMKIMSDSLDTVGVMARGVADCALFAGAVSGRDLGDPDRHPGKTPRIGLCRSPAWDGHAAPETKALFERIAASLGRAGAVLTDLELPPVIADLVAAHPVVMNAESARALGWELTQHRDRLTPILRDRMDEGMARTEAELDRAAAAFRAAQAAFPSVAEYVDCIVTPAAPGEAPEGLEWTGEPAFNSIWTSLHVPCVTVPAGAGPNGLPLGIQIVGRRGDDAAILAWAQWVAAQIG